MQHGIEAALVASLDRTGPRIGPGSLGVALQIKDVHDAFPHCLALEDLFDGLRADQHAQLVTAADVADRLALS